MQTNFTIAALADPAMRESEKILRTCVHCGFCTATCPTYLLLGDELDSPRGRIYLIKDMLEGGKPASEEVVKHVDRCLSCLSCMTTCPSGVHYMHLVDHARAYIDHTYTRSAPDRFMRALLARILPYPQRFRAALFAALLAKPARPLVGALPFVGKRMAAMLALAPARAPAPPPVERLAIATPQRARVAILEGCAQPALAPSINAAARRLFARLGVAVVPAPGEGCCGALVHHMGREEDALAFARANVDAWTRLIENGGLDAIVITASGCGTTIKDYGYMLRADAAYAQKAARVSALAKDVTEFLSTLDLAPAPPAGLTLAYHSACSMQHGQKITDLPKNLLRNAGFAVKDVPESHICCGSAGTYNIMQSELAGRLRDRKLGNIARLKVDAVAAGNIGCIAQLSSGAGAPPVVHTVELLDWAYGGPRPEALPKN
ncbi:MAG: glycolate oxidase subunit GlcF [Hyphomicrobiales bacterium]|nr:glycolate oxidase subunit GlcF [Hyphomicrobiales bacterium]